MPDYCLICYNEISPKTGWLSLIAAEKKQTLCPSCRGKMADIEGTVCTICQRPLAKLDPRYIHGETCNDCVRWEKDPAWQGCLEQNHSFFLYNEFLQEVIARFKFRGDYILAAVFAEFIHEKLKNIEADLLVPIPLSRERLQERGFNQAEALILEAGLTPDNILTRIHTEKQSKKSRQERIHVAQVFQLKPGAEIAGKRILLFDDIYTTGSTLHHAAKKLKTSGAASIVSITIARG